MDTQDTQQTEFPQSPTAGAARRFRIPGDTVNKATADLDDRERSAIRWLHAHASEEDLGLDAIGKLIGYDAATVSKLFSGKYEASIAGPVKQIETFKALHEKRSTGRKLEFIETDLARRVWNLCDAALEYQRIAFLIGPTQIGKTEILKKYQVDHNHGSTIYVSVPTGGAVWKFLPELARALRINPQQRPAELVRRIKDAFDNRMLLIVDEAHQCLYSRNVASGSQVIEFIREIFDATQCGVLICGTELFGDEMENGRFAGILKQCKRRRLATMRIGGIPDKADLNTFAAAYSLEPARDEALILQTEIIRDEALGFWLTLLRMASKVAHKKHERLTWSHVIRAHAGLRSLEGKV